MKQTRRWINTRVEFEWDEDLQRFVDKTVEGYWYDGPMSLAHNLPDLDQVHYKFWESDASTQVANTDTAPTLSVDTTYVLQVEIENIGDEISVSEVFDFQYNLASAGWNNVTGASSVVRTANPTGITDGTATVSGDNLGSAKLFTAGEECEDGTTAAMQINSTDTTPEYTDHRFGFTILSADVTNGQTLEFRATRASWTALDTYTVAISSTISEASDTSVTAIVDALVLDDTNLATISLDVDVTAIADSLVLDDTNVATITYDRNVTAITDALVLDDTNVSLITLGTTVTGITDSLVLDDTELATITFDVGVTAIADNLVLDDTSVAAIAYDRNITALIDQLILDDTAVAGIALGEPPAASAMTWNKRARGKRMGTRTIADSPYHSK